MSVQFCIGWPRFVCSAGTANYASKTFRIKGNAERWANEQEDRLDGGENISKHGSDKTDIIGDLIELHLSDMAEVGRPARRSKEHALVHPPSPPEHRGGTSKGAPRFPGQPCAKDGEREKMIDRKAQKP
jgi:hypothetical protein